MKTHVHKVKNEEEMLHYLGRIPDHHEEHLRYKEKYEDDSLI